MNDLRETPSSNGRRNFVKLRRFASNCKFCSSVFPKPIPAIQNNLSGETPAAVQFFQTFLKKFADLANHIVYAGFFCIVCGVPCACMQT